ncbi:MAG: TAT-variant-translocated molybdopterin oxidoreductase [Verrucomicrobia bacterium]|nr:TAT-variant-translocated molybdopterin oxidoreductase [Verrucomicrobiota bacterium]
MNKFLKHPEPTESDLKGPHYWKSLDDLAETDGFKEYLHREFPEGASELDGVNRRQFLKVMSASFAFAGVGLAGCRRPEKYVMPYSKQPEEIIHGKPLYYASAMPHRNDPVALVAETHEGRPTKLEGNDQLEGRNGSTDQYAQAALLDLYDPDRSKKTVHAGRSLTEAQRTDYLTSVSKKYAENGGEGLAFLAEGIPSLTRAAQLKQLKAKLPKAIWAEYDAIDTSNPDKAAAKVLGKSVRAIYDFTKADRVLSLEADFLYSDPNHLVYTRDFSKARQVEDDHPSMNRLYAAESYYSITGGMADHRLRIASSEIPSLTSLIAAAIFEIAGAGQQAIDSLRSSGEGLDVDPQWIEECAKDLVDHSGHSLIVAGPHQPEAVHALVIAMNEVLQAQGSTVNYIDTPENEASSLSDLANAIGQNNVKTLVILGGNPVYNAPVDLHWADVQDKVEEVIRLGQYFDETSGKSDCHINEANFLESWGDAVSFDGTVLAIQPMILPLFKGLTECEVLEMIINGQPKEGYSIVFDAVTQSLGGTVKDFEKFLHDGFWAGTTKKAVSTNINRRAVSQLLQSAEITSSDLSSTNLEVRFIADPSVDDGRYINNGWLQECPDPITKLAWDNAFLISPNYAAELGIVAKDPYVSVVNKNPNAHKRGKEQAHLIEVTVNGNTLAGPAHVQPGLPDYTLVVSLGYGRTVTGRVGEGSGFNAYTLRTSSGLSSVTGASVKTVGGVQQLADTQEHWSMEGRAIIREANLDFYKEHSDFVDHMGMESHSPAPLGLDANSGNRRDTVPLQELIVAGEKNRGNSLYVTPEFTGTHQWGMSINLNTCTGCNACVIACQSENNIPVVGREQVLRGREMHWIRLDRYYSAGPDQKMSDIPVNPQVSLQPMTCQHCETAPCETVCPVNATVHDDEGLNVMAYNRCVGTRYCANNCPYKVRRFNFFDWNDRDLDHLYEGPLGPHGMEELQKMSKNPEVSIRMRGVMEKCTYCLQRIQAAKIDQKVKAGASGDVKVPDGTIQTACQQVCPAGAIVFGDVSDPESRVSRLKDSNRDYGVLAYLNTRPRTTYLAKLRNPNPLMPDYYDNPLSHLEYNKASGHAEEHGDSHSGSEEGAHATEASGPSGH